MSVPDFKLGAITWTCCVLSDGTGRYEWRSSCGRFAVSREGAAVWLSHNNKRTGRPHRDLISAMRFAHAYERIAA